MEAVGRNELCPCGSGKKYKNCHLGKALPNEAGDPKLPMGIGLASVVGGAGVTAAADWTMGVVTIGTGLVVALAVHVFRDPPPPGGSDKNPAGLDFGR